MSSRVRDSAAANVNEDVLDLNKKDAGFLQKMSLEMAFLAQLQLAQAST
jgi:hypothetical protein